MDIIAISATSLINFKQKRISNFIRNELVEFEELVNVPSRKSAFWGRKKYFIRFFMVWGMHTSVF